MNKQKTYNLAKKMFQTEDQCIKPLMWNIFLVNNILFKF